MSNSTSSEVNPASRANPVDPNVDSRSFGLLRFSIQLCEFLMIN